MRAPSRSATPVTFSRAYPAVPSQIREIRADLGALPIGAGTVTVPQPRVPQLLPQRRVQGSRRRLLREACSDMGCMGRSSLSPQKKNGKYRLPECLDFR